VLPETFNKFTNVVVLLWELLFVSVARPLMKKRREKELLVTAAAAANNKPTYFEKQFFAVIFGQLRSTCISTIMRTTNRNRGNQILRKPHRES
jgi:hypothetical protein